MSDKKPEILKPHKSGAVTPEIAKNAVLEFNKIKDKEYPKEQELYDRLVSLAHEYDGELSIVSVVGILDLVKDEVKEA